MIHAFSVDLEEWFHGIELPRESWLGKERRLRRGLDTLLGLLDEARCLATFFVLGAVAEEYPDVVQSLSEAGHEIASHGRWHEKLYEQGPHGFRETEKRNKETLEDLIGGGVEGHRAPYFSLTGQSLWAFEILQELGYTYDCSVSPVVTWRYGIPGVAEGIFRFDEVDLIEFTPSTWGLAGRRLLAGGAYFRIFPLFLVKRAFIHAERVGRPAMFYVHPWEYDPGHPVLPIERKAQFTHYRNLEAMGHRTARLLANHEFGTVSHAMRPKVLHSMTWLAPGGGVDQNVSLSIRGMLESYDFHLVVGPEIHQNDFEGIPGLTLHICPHLIRAINPWRDFLALLWLAKSIRRERYDLIHTHETKASLLTRLAARIARVGPVIYGLHGVPFNDPISSPRRHLYVWVERLTIGAADYIVSVSRDVIQQYHERGIGRKIPFEVIHNGVDLRRFDSALNHEEVTALRRSFGAQDDDLVLINVRRFSPAKDQKSTIDAFAGVLSARPDALLLLVGEGQERSACEKQARSLKVDHRVRFLGFREDIPQLLKSADIHVLTSLREGLPRVAVEASLASVPTVAFEVDGVREIVHDGQSGYITPTGDVEVLTERIIRLAASVDLRGQMGRRAFEHAAAHWDHHTMLQRLDSLYTQILARAKHE